MQPKKDTQRNQLHFFKINQIDDYQMNPPGLKTVNLSQNQPISKPSSQTKKFLRVKPIPLRLQTQSPESQNSPAKQIVASRMENLYLLPITDESVYDVYVEMLNRERDIFYLYDSFNEVIDSLKGFYLSNQKQKWYKQQEPQSKQVSTRKWTGLSGLKNLEARGMHSADEAETFEINYYSRKQQSNSVLQNLVPGLQKQKQNKINYLGNNMVSSQGSVIVQKIRREVEQLETSISHQSRCINDQVQVMNFSQEYLKKRFADKRLLGLYQSHNKIYKNHLGFILLREDENKVVLTKFFLAISFRRENFIIYAIKQLQTMYPYKRIIIKLNSNNSTLTLFYQCGFKLVAEQVLIGSINVITLQYKKM